jgi:hypothetical protein
MNVKYANGFYYFGCVNFRSKRGLFYTTYYVVHAPNSKADDGQNVWRILQIEGQREKSSQNEDLFSETKYKSFCIYSPFSVSFLYEHI